MSRGPDVEYYLHTYLCEKCKLVYQLIIWVYTLDGPWVRRILAMREKTQTTRTLKASRVRKLRIIATSAMFRPRSRQSTDVCGNTLVQQRRTWRTAGSSARIALSKKQWHTTLYTFFATSKRRKDSDTLCRTESLAQIANSQ